MSTRPNSSSKAKFVLLAATLGILFVGLELGLRALGLPPDSRFEQRTQYVGLRVQASREPLPNTAHEGGRGSLYRYVPGSQWATKYTSNPRGYFEDGNVMRYRINNHGFRGPDITQEKTGYRVACIGDSITFGEGVRWEDTFAKLLQGHLSKTLPGVEVNNFGVNGYELLHERVLLEQVVSRFEPDLLVWQYYLNDITVFEIDELTNHLVHTEQSSLLLSGPSHLVNFVSRPLWSRHLTGRFEARMHELYNSRWDDLVRDFSIVQEHARRTGAGLLVVIFPDLDFLRRGDYAYRPIHQKLSSFFESKGIRYIDLAPPFAENPGELRIHPIDAHPNEVAHRLVADLIFAELARNEAAPVSVRK